MSDLSDLYQEVILDHNKRPRNFRIIENASHHAEGYNPLCGDRLDLFLTVEGNVVRDAAFQGSGCAISRASASLMTDAIKGLPLDEVEWWRGFAPALAELRSRRVKALYPTGEIGVLGGSVPGVAGAGTSTSGPCGGVSGGAGVGWPGCVGSALVAGTGATAGPSGRMPLGASGVRDAARRADRRSARSDRK